MTRLRFLSTFCLGLAASVAAYFGQRKPEVYFDYRNGIRAPRGSMLWIEGSDILARHYNLFYADSSGLVGMYGFKVAYRDGNAVEHWERFADMKYLRGGAWDSGRA